MAVIGRREIFHTTHNIEEIEFIDEEIYQAPHSNNSYFTNYKVGLCSPVNLTRVEQGRSQIQMEDHGTFLAFHCVFME